MQNFYHFQLRHKVFLYCGLTLLILFTIILNLKITSNAETLVASQEIIHHHVGNSSSSGGCYTITKYHRHSGSPTSGGGCYTITVTHHHSGSSTYGGGCYTESHTEEEWEGCYGSDYCDQGPCGPDSSGQVYYVGTCPICYANLNVYNSPGWSNCSNGRMVTNTYYSLACGMYEGQVTSYKLGCQKSETTIEGYLPACNMDENEVIGHFKVSKSTDEWCTQAKIHIEINPESIADSVNPVSVNGENGGYIYPVSSNGDYQVVANLIEGYTASPVSVVFDNIDNTAPQINDYTFNTLDSTYDPVSIIINDVSDLQPDGSEGCGLDDSPYSYDNGSSWTNESSYSYAANGSYTLLVRDKLGNTAAVEYTVSNISPRPDPEPEIDPVPDEPQDPPAPPVPDDPSDPIVDPNPNNPPVRITPPITPGINDPKPKVVEPTVPKPKIPTPSVSEKASVSANVPKTQTIKTQDNLSESISESKTLSSTKDNFSLTDILIPIIISLLILALIGLLMFLIYRIVLVYDYEGKENYRFKGIAFIHSKSEGLELTITEKITDKCNTGRLRLKPSVLFVVFHSKSDISIYYLEKQSVRKRIEKNISLNIR